MFTKHLQFTKYLLRNSKCLVNQFKLQFAWLANKQPKTWNL